MMVLAALVLAGCPAPTPVVEEPPSPPPTAAESLIGSWEVDSPWVRDEVVIGIRIYTLAFTPDRWIGNLSHYYTDGTFEEEHSYTQSGGWSATDTEITRSWFNTENDQVENITKAYSWADDDRTAMYLKSWENDIVLSDAFFELYTKQEAPSDDLSGAWRYEVWNVWEGPDGQRQEFRQAFTLEITESTLTYVFIEQDREHYGTDEGISGMTLTGPLEQDTVNQFLQHTVTARDTTWRDDNPDPPIGQTVRWGYLRVDDVLFVSPHWAEQRYDEDTDTMVDHERPYGNYWLRMLQVP